MGDLDPQLDQFLRKQPSLGEGVYLASTAVVVGDVRIGDYSSVWYHAVLRGDINYIRVGAYTNIQDGAVVHLADEHPCEIGDWVTVGHSAVVHACEIGNECLIGMNCTILDGAVIGAQSVVGANALVTGGTQIPPAHWSWAVLPKSCGHSPRPNVPTSSRGLKSTWTTPPIA